MDSHKVGLTDEIIAISGGQFGRGDATIMANSAMEQIPIAMSLSRF